MAPAPEGIVTEIRRAIVNYGKFANEEVEKAVLAAINDLDADLVEGEYSQSTRADVAVQRLNEAMNVADEAREAEEMSEEETE